MTQTNRSDETVGEARTLGRVVDDFLSAPDLWAKKPTKRTRRLLLGILGAETTALWVAPAPAGADPDDLQARTPAFPRSSRSMVPDGQIPALHRAIWTLAPFVEVVEAELGNAKSMEAQFLAVTPDDPERAKAAARQQARDQRITLAGPLVAALLADHPQQRAALLADRHAVPEDLVRLADERVRAMILQRYAQTQDTLALIEAMPDSQLQNLIDDVRQGGTYEQPMTPRVLRDLAVAELEREAAQPNRGVPVDLVLFLERLLQLSARPQQFASEVRPLWEWLELHGGSRVVEVAQQIRPKESDNFYIDHWSEVQKSAERLLRRVHLTLASTSEQEFRAWLDRSARAKAKGMPARIVESLDRPWSSADWSDPGTAEALGMYLADGGPSMVATERPQEEPDSDDGSGQDTDPNLLALQRILAVLGDQAPKVADSHPGLLPPEQAERLRHWLANEAADEIMEADPGAELVDRVVASAHRMLNAGPPKRRIGLKRVSQFIEAALGALSYQDFKATLRDDRP